MFYYLLIKKYFKFLTIDYDFKLSYRSKMGWIYIHYLSPKLRIVVLGQENIKLLFSDADSMGTYADITEYGDEFITKGSDRKKVAKAAEWLKNHLKEINYQ